MVLGGFGGFFALGDVLVCGSEGVMKEGRGGGDGLLFPFSEGEGEGKGEMNTKRGDLGHVYFHSWFWFLYKFSPYLKISHTTAPVSASFPFPYNQDAKCNSRTPIPPPFFPNSSSTDSMHILPAFLNAGFHRNEARARLLLGEILRRELIPAG